MDEKEIREKAEKRVEEKRGFIGNLAAYIIVNAGLFLIWLFTGHGSPWFIWPLLGWGIGVVFHFFSVYVAGPGNAWQQREVDREMERIKQQSKNELHPS